MPRYAPNKSNEEFNKEMQKSFLAAKNVVNKNKKGFLASVTETLRNGIASISAKMNKMHWFSLIFGISKRNKTGRLGAKSLKLDDVIENMSAEDGTALKNGEGKDAFFNPFADIRQLEGDNEESELGQMQHTFRNRVYAQRNLARKNDFEAKYYDEATRAADFFGFADKDDASGAEFIEKFSGENATDVVSEGRIKSAQDVYDAEKEFVPDEPVYGEIPDNFKVGIHSGVDIQNYFVEMSNRYTLAKSKGKKTSEQRETEKQDALDYAMMNSSPYKELVEQGKAEAKAAGMKYDPKKDPNLAMVKNMTEMVDFKKQGHAKIALKAFKGDSKVSSYSFGFVPFSNVGARGFAGVGLGSVQNPDPVEGTYGREVPVTYSNYLKAAAKIRGIKSSMRMYALLGYNCTAFVQDVAKEAGINIPVEESTADMVTNFSKKHRMDTPYTLALWIKNQNRKDMDNNEEGIKYTEVVKSPVIREIRGNAASFLADVAKQNAPSSDEEEALGIRGYLSRWNAMLAKNSKPGAAGNDISKIVADVLEFYREDIEPYKDRISENHMDFTAAEDEKEYLDKVNELSGKMKQKYGTDSIFQFIDWICSNNESAVAKYNGLITERDERKKAEAEKKEKIKKDNKSRSDLVTKNIGLLSEKEDIDFGEDVDDTEYDEEPEFASDEDNIKVIEDAINFDKMVSKGAIMAVNAFLKVKVDKHQAAVIINEVVRREPYAQNIVENNMKSDMKINNPARAAMSLNNDIDDILGAYDDGKYHNRVKTIMEYVAHKLGLDA